MLRKLYDWTVSLAEHPRALWALAIVAFVESSFFPLPPDLLIIPMVLAAPTRWFRIATVATIASVLGGIFGYYIGYALFDTVGQPILSFYGKDAAFETFKENYNNWGAWAVLIAGVTPFPFKVITITSGVTQLNLGVFVVSSIIGGALPFFIVAALLRKFGPPVRDFIERRLGLVFTLFCIALIGGFMLVKYL